MSLAERTALVTGGARGIGLAITERLVADGARVMIADLDGAAAKKATERLGDSVRGAGRRRQPRGSRRADRVGHPSSAGAGSTSS